MSALAAILGNSQRPQLYISNAFPRKLKGHDTSCDDCLFKYLQGGCKREWVSGAPSNFCLNFCQMFVNFHCYYIEFRCIYNGKMVHEGNFHCWNNNPTKN